MANREYSLTLHNNIDRDIYVRPCITIRNYGYGGIIDYTSKLGTKIKREPNGWIRIGIDKTFKININKEEVGDTSVSLKYNNQDIEQNINIEKTQEQIISGTNPNIELYKNLEYNTNGYNNNQDAGDTYKIIINEDEYTAVVENITELDMTDCVITNLNPLCEELIIDGNKLVQSGGNYGTYEYVDTNSQTVSGTIDGYEVLSNVLGYCQNNNIKVTLEFNISNLFGFEIDFSSVLCKTKRMSKIFDNDESVIVQLSPLYTLQKYDTEIDYRTIVTESGIHKLMKGSSYTLYMVGVTPNSEVDIYKDNQLIDKEVYGRVDIILN